MIYIKAVGTKRTICHKLVCWIYKVGMVNYLILVINDFDANIEFNYETETECKLPFLDVQ